MLLGLPAVLSVLGAHQPSPYQSTAIPGSGAPSRSEGRFPSYASPRQPSAPPSPSWASRVVAGSPQCAYVPSLASPPVPGSGSPRYSQCNGHQLPSQGQSTEALRTAGEAGRSGNLPSVPTAQHCSGTADEGGGGPGLASPSFSSAPSSWASGPAGPVALSRSLPQVLPGVGQGGGLEQPGFSSVGGGGGTANSPGSTPSSRASNESSNASSSSSSATAGVVAPSASIASASDSAQLLAVSANDRSSFSASSVTGARDTSPTMSSSKSSCIRSDALVPQPSPLEPKPVSPPVPPYQHSQALPVGPPLSPDTLRRLLNARRGHIRKNPLLRYLEGTAYAPSKRGRSPGDSETRCTEDVPEAGPTLRLRGCRTPINSDLYYGYAPSHAPSSGNFPPNLSGSLFLSTVNGPGGSAGMPSGGGGTGISKHHSSSSKSAALKNTSSSSGSHVGPLTSKEASGPPNQTPSSSASRVGGTGGKDLADASSVCQTAHADRKGQNPPPHSSSSSAVIGNTAALSANTLAATAKDDSLQWCHLQIQQVLSQNREIARAAGKARGCRPLLHQSVIADAALAAGGVAASSVVGCGGQSHSQPHPSPNETAAGWRRWRDVDVVPPPPQLEELLLVLAAAVKVHIAGADTLLPSCTFLATSVPSKYPTLYLFTVRSCFAVTLLPAPRSTRVQAVLVASAQKSPEAGMSPKVAVFLR